MLFQKSIKESLDAPEILMTDFAKFDRPGLLHIGFQALYQYQAKKGSLPKPRCKVGTIYIEGLQSCQQVDI